ncbi:MAG: ABC transporter ATP-binding protein [Planctomycetota bacterium]|nr:ABC transporter ATP-binding protein [Planctomycetota bacterium]
MNDAGIVAPSRGEAAPGGRTGRSSDEAISCRGLKRCFDDGGVKLWILRGADLSVRRGEMMAIVGRSGSGKSTLLHLLGLLDRPTEGEVFIEGRAAGGLSERERAALRNTRIGFVFQTYHLMPEFTVLENVLIPAMVHETPFRWLAGAGKRHRARAGEILEAIGLRDAARKLPRTLSGGERQRVAIGRALMMDPDVLLCDEPTGNLDPKTAGTIMDLLEEIRERRGKAIVVVTHDEKVARMAGRVLRLSDGTLSPDD